MSEKKKISVSKPPVPARPKNLLVLNSKHLPKPPEKFVSEKVSTLIKNIHINDKNHEAQDKNSVNNANQRFENSDSEDESYGYLEPVSLSSTTSTKTSTVGKVIPQVQQKNPNYENSIKFRDYCKQIDLKNDSVKSEVPETEEAKPQITQSQWQRPLPSIPLPPEDSKSVVMTMPWYKNVDRKKGEEILKNGVDGYFLVRPSSNAETYLTLTLWYNARVYNIPIRKRKDGKFALGTPKTNEQCFDSVEHLVKNYQSEKLVLYSHGVQTGKTLLTTNPP